MRIRCTESTITLIPSVYCNQFSGDTGIMHKVLSAQTTDGLKFVVKYDSSTKMWEARRGSQADGHLGDVRQA